MTFPVVESDSITNIDSSSSSHVITMPSGIQAGDLLIIIFDHDSTAPTYTLTGWTQLFDEEIFALNEMECYWKEAVGSDTLTVTVSPANTGNYNIYRISGAIDPDTQPPEHAVVQSSNPPSLSPTGGSKDYLWITGHGTSTTNNASPPANYSNELSARTGSQAMESARRELTAANENPGAWGTPGQNPISCIIAVHPAPSAPVVDLVSPNTGPDTGQTIITISGSLFVATPTVTIGGASALSVVFNSSTSLTVVTPAGAIGAQDVAVTNPDAQSDTLAGGFIYTGTPSDGITLNCPTVIRRSRMVAY